jgi:hypothetical protein
MNDIYHYHTNWKEGKVNQMWIQEIGDCKYVAIAYNPANNTSMVMSKPRAYHATLDWVRRWCGTFCIL